MKVSIYYLDKSRVLGKGERFVIYFQGCEFKCKGCLVKDSWDISKGEWMEIDEIVSKIKGVEGVTISGGEPFLQKEALFELVKEVKKKNLNIIIYTGFLYEELLKDEISSNILEYADLLIDGRYEEELDYNTPLVGSINQKVLILSDEGLELAEFMKLKNKREVEFKIKDNDIFLLGVPPNNLIQRIINER